MIPAVPTSRLMLLLTTIIAVLSLMATCWMPQVGAFPVFNPDAGDQNPRHTCSTNLSDLIQQMCQGRTLSYRDLYPNIFGKRRKRESHEIVDRCCKTSCDYKEILEFCAR